MAGQWRGETVPTNLDRQVKKRKNNSRSLRTLSASLGSGVKMALFIRGLNHQLFPINQLGTPRAAVGV
jgi:hypothetical protein